ncbi:MAG TPA: DUF6569 family protein [Chthonomonadaceae bacterium]|nr:DUF6569 family protein [Chthonomonadaceae bacterium]
MISRKMGAIVAAAGCSALAGWFVVASAQRGPGAAQASLDGRHTLGQPKAFRNLAIYPVYDASARAGDTYITLDEGLKAHRVTVKESPDGGSVTTLYITNRSPRPLYVMAGEVVLGGQQDRTLARDTIVAAGKTRMPVTVFCVEHGRWSGRSEFGNSAPAVASLSIRASAMSGEFNAERKRIAARSGAAGRAATPVDSQGVAGGVQSEMAPRAEDTEDVAKAQQEVWDGVAAKNRKFKIQNRTGTYRDALTLNGGDAQKSVPAYVKSLSAGFGENSSRLVGVVAAVNGKVIAADIFSEPALFHKLWPKLLRSYASDAVEGAPASGSAAPGKRLSVREVKAFMGAARNERSKQVNDTDGGRLLRYESDGASVYGLVPAGRAAGGAPVHESFIKK